MRRHFGMDLQKIALALVVALACVSAPFTALGQTASDNKPTDSGDDEEQLQTVRIEDKIPPVSGRLFFKRHRFELSPTFNVSFGDAFFQKLGVALKADYHIFETFSVTAHVAYHFNLTSHAVSICDSSGACGSPEVESLTNVPGKLGLLVGAGISWTPIYGKLSLFSEKVIHFDLGLTGGIDGIQYMVPSELGEEHPFFDKAGGNTFTFGGHFGLIARLIFSERIAMRFELRDYVYNGATVKLGKETSKIENQIMFEIGLSFLLGAGSED